MSSTLLIIIEFREVSLRSAAALRYLLAVFIVYVLEKLVPLNTATL